MPWQALLPVPAALEQGVGSPHPGYPQLLLPGAWKASVSLLVGEQESLDKDGGWERAALPAEFIPPGLEKCPDSRAEQLARILQQWQPVVPSKSHGTKSGEGFQPWFV